MTDFKYDERDELVLRNNSASYFLHSLEKISNKLSCSFILSQDDDGKYYNLFRNHLLI